jgi:tetratricopeptide (TPR) repeat protein
MTASLTSIIRSSATLVLSLAMAWTAGPFVAAQEAEATAGTDADGSENGEATATAAANITAEQATTAANEGQEAIANADFEKAYKDFTTVLQWGAANQFTEHADRSAFAILIGYTGRGQALAGLEEYEAALQEFKLALDIEPNFTPTLIARGTMYLDLGAADQGLPDFEKAAKASRADMRAQFGLGKAYILLGGWQQGIKPLSRVIDADPENAEAYRLRGSGLAAIYKTPEAIQDLEKAISLNPEDYEAYFTLGMVYLRDEEYQKSVDQLQQAIQHYKPKPGQEEMPYLQGHLTLASAYIEHGKSLNDEAAKKAAYQAAVDETNRLLYQYDPKNPGLAPYRAAVLYSRGVGERMLGELGTAIASLSEAIRLNPDMSEAYFKRGICFHLLDEDRMAISDFVQAANINYEDPRSSLWEGFTFAKLGDYHEAIRAYGKAIAASDRYTPAYVNRGLAYLKLGQHEKAVADFNDAIRLEPTEAEHYFKRGLAYRELGELEKASGSFANAIQFNDKHHAAYRHMASTLQSLGRTELANEYRQKAEALPQSTSDE